MEPFEATANRFFALLVGAAGLLFAIVILAIIALFYLQRKQSQKINKIRDDSKKILEKFQKDLEQTSQADIKELRQEFEQQKEERKNDDRALKKWLDEKLEALRLRYENYVSRVEKMIQNIEETRVSVARGVGRIARIIAIISRGGGKALTQVLEKAGSEPNTEAEKNKVDHSASGELANTPPPVEPE